ncbi:hypothetical protein MUK42_35273 [Musa troglodytarum]|uniref:Uncharacterized protein n=1 Tax=Musa troglodytarum TaxID=320322 RepID=A0A9E7H225_9LILI|nr:hypothetical protein MUK42_35273 [Musa troglodytarum]
MPVEKISNSRTRQRGNIPTKKFPLSSRYHQHPRTDRNKMKREKKKKGETAGNYSKIICLGRRISSVLLPPSGTLFRSNAWWYIQRDNGRSE